jgi:hypothetical protein
MIWGGTDFSLRHKDIPHTRGMLLANPKSENHCPPTRHEQSLGEIESRNRSR